MKRSTFLASIIAFVTAPFVIKAKPVKAMPKVFAFVWDQGEPGQGASEYPLFANEDAYTAEEIQEATERINRTMKEHLDRAGREWK